VGTSSFILAQKLKSTKAALKVWNSIYFGNIQHRIHTLLSQLDVLQRSQTFPHTSTEEWTIKKTLDDLYLQEEILWKNKSRETWLTCKDLNTRFFHVSTIIKRRRTSIDFLKLPMGAWITDRADIGNCFSSHFSSLFTTSNPPCPDEFLSLFENSISSDENVTLCTIPSELEIFNALTALFYKKYWSIVKDVVLRSV
jgi:hypothetical protein